MTGEREHRTDVRTRAHTIRLHRKRFADHAMPSPRENGTKFILWAAGNPVKLAVRSPPRSILWDNKLSSEGTSEVFRVKNEEENDMEAFLAGVAALTVKRRSCWRSGPVALPRHREGIRTRPSPADGVWSDQVNIPLSAAVTTVRRQAAGRGPEPPLQHGDRH